MNHSVIILSLIIVSKSTGKIMFFTQYCVEKPVQNVEKEKGPSKSGNAQRWAFVKFETWIFKL